MEDLKEQQQIRRAKLEKYLEKGINPFGHKFNVTSNSHLIKQMAHGKDHDQLEAEQINVSIAGRIMMMRRMGKATFFHLLDREGMIQCYIKKDVVGDEIYELLDLADLGDIVGISGTLMLTKTSEITVRVNEYTHLVKALRPLPDKYHGLSDVEERYRRRYVDLIVNEQAREVAIKRNKIIRTIQSFMDDLGYLEFETSVLQPILGGASARPFVVHHNALSSDFYLRIATELPLKRLLVGGLEKVYEIGRLFRNEGIDTKHNPEFTTMEAYLAYGNLEDMRLLAENLFKEVALKVNGSLKLPWGDKVIDLDQPFEQISMVALVKRETGIDFSAHMSLEDALALAKQHHIKLEPHQKTYGHIINEFFELYCEKKLIQPTFVYNHPIEISPLARKSADPRFTERFELFIDGSEYANAFTELNNPIDQLERFKQQHKARELGDLEASEIDTDFVEALEYGMPPAGGIGFGIDRLVMLMTNNQSIREVILFPLLRHK